MSWYEARFAEACKAARERPNLEERLAELRATFTIVLYRSVTRSLFEKHKILFSLALTGTRILLSPHPLPTSFPHHPHFTYPFPHLLSPSPLPTHTSQAKCLMRTASSTSQNGSS